MKTLLTIFIRAFLFIIGSCDGQRINLHNWAGTLQYSTQNIQYSRSVAQVKQIVTGAQRVRCLAQRHSFNRIGDSNDTLLATVGLKNIINPSVPGILTAINPLVPSVWVQAGVTYTDLAPFLQSAGYALANLASLAEISVAGATQTGVHGSGNRLGCLGTQIRAMQLVKADGTVVLILPGDPRLKALAVGLGAFGVVTAVELKIERTYNVTNYVFLGLPNEEFLAHFDAIMSAGYSVQVFADFLTPNVWNQVWVIDRSDSGSNIGTQQTLLDTSAVRATEQVSPMIFLPPTYISRQGIEQPWYFGLVDYHLGLSGTDDYRNSISGIGSGGDEIQTEYFLPYENATAAIRAMSVYWEAIGLAVWYVDVRTIAGDDLWMSMSQGTGRTVAIALTFKPLPKLLLDPVVLLVEEALIPFGARPHWAKYFLMAPERFLHRYPRLADFRALAEQFDPTHKFRNVFLEQNVFTNGNGGPNGSSTGVGGILGAIGSFFG